MYFVIRGVCDESRRGKKIVLWSEECVINSREDKYLCVFWSEEYLMDSHEDKYLSCG